MSKYSDVSRRLVVSGLAYTVTGPFGPRTHPIKKTPDFHTGTDYNTPSGTPLASPWDGVVTGVSKNDSEEGYGGTVFIYNERVDRTYYASHMKDFDVVVGQQVKKGQRIGLSGGAKKPRRDKYSGSSTGPHLHAGIVLGKRSSVPPKKGNAHLFTDIETYDFTILDQVVQKDIKVGDIITIIDDGENVQYATVNSDGKTKGDMNHSNKMYEVIKVDKDKSNPIRVRKIGSNNPKDIIGWFKLDQIKGKEDSKPTQPTTPKKAKIKKGAKYVSKSKASNGKKVGDAYTSKSYDFVLNKVSDKPDWVYIKQLNSYVHKNDVEFV